MREIWSDNFLLKHLKDILNSLCGFLGSIPVQPACPFEEFKIKIERKWQWDKTAHQETNVFRSFVKNPDNRLEESDGVEQNHNQEITSFVHSYTLWFYD